MTMVLVVVGVCNSTLMTFELDAIVPVTEYFVHAEVRTKAVLIIETFWSAISRFIVCAPPVSFIHKEKVKVLDAIGV